MADEQLRALIEAATARYDALTPEQRREADAAQRRSWVRGNLMLEYPDMTHEKADSLVREAEGLAAPAVRSEASHPHPEVTPEMIEAGMEADETTPGTRRDIYTAIYRAMKAKEPR